MKTKTNKLNLKKFKIAKINKIGKRLILGGNGHNEACKAQGTQGYNATTMD